MSDIANRTPAALLSESHGYVESLFSLNDGAKKRASRINKNQGLVIEIFLDLVAEVKKEIYSAVQSTTYTELKDIPVIDGKNGKEICVRNTKCITIIS